MAPGLVVDIEKRIWIYWVAYSDGISYLTTATTSMRMVASHVTPFVNANSGRDSVYR